MEVAHASSLLSEPHSRSQEDNFISFFAAGPQWRMRKMGLSGAEAARIIEKGNCGSDPQRKVVVLGPISK